MNGYRLNHVALCITPLEVIEAIEPSVQRISLEKFLKAAATDRSKKPRVLVTRLKKEFAPLIPSAIARSQQLLGLPYDRAFGNGPDAYYCSKLILDVFKHANAGDFLFPETPMNFTDPSTGRTSDVWIRYYKELGLPVPEGEPGSHPALLSRSEHLTVIHQFGEFESL